MPALSILPIEEAAAQYLSACAIYMLTANRPTQSKTMTRASASAALETLAVLDLTRVRAGPTCVRQLADWGAKVIKIEMPEEGGSSTQTDFSQRHEADFQNLHRNKRAMTLNLKSAEGIAILRRMVAQADVIVENYRPDVKHRLGIDYAALSQSILASSMRAFPASARMDHIAIVQALIRSPRGCRD